MSCACQSQRLGLQRVGRRCEQLRQTRKPRWRVRRTLGRDALPLRVRGVFLSVEEDEDHDSQNCMPLYPAECAARHAGRVAGTAHFRLPVMYRGAGVRAGSSAVQRLNTSPPCSPGTAGGLSMPASIACRPRSTQTRPRNGSRIRARVLHLRELEHRLTG